MVLDGEQMMREYNHVYKEMNELYHYAAKRLHLSDSAFDILYAVYVLGEGCTQKDICGYSGSSKQTIHSSIKKLEREGLLRMESGSGRTVRVFPTAAGRAVMEQKIAPVVEAEKDALKHVDTLMWPVILDFLKSNLRYLRERFENL